MIASRSSQRVVRPARPERPFGVLGYPPELLSEVRSRGAVHNLACGRPTPDAPHPRAKSRQLARVSTPIVLLFPMKILLVEDEADLAHWLSRALARQAGFVVDWTDDGLLAERRLLQEEFDAVVLDLGIPGMDGETLLARMRARDDRTPVLVLTARDSLASRVGLLRDGADDFLPKPFVLEELEARLSALIRRSRGREFQRMSCGGLVFDLGSQRFTLGGEVLSLTPREQAVLRALLQRSGEPVSKQAIMERLLPGNEDLNPDAVEVIVHRLRKKLQDSGVRIVTMRGLGYCLEQEA